MFTSPSKGTTAVNYRQGLIFSTEMPVKEFMLILNSSKTCRMGPVSQERCFATGNLTQISPVCPDLALWVNQLSLPLEFYILVLVQI